MSKTAIAALETAARVAGIAPDFLTSFIAKAQWRKEMGWHNADSLASLIIGSMGNAFQCNTSDDMNEAIRGHVQSALDDWNGKEWKGSISKELAFLVRYVRDNAAFEQRLAVSKATGATMGDVKSYLAANFGNAELVTVALNNMDQAYPLDVNPLGYVITDVNSIHKIKDVQLCEDYRNGAFIDCTDGHKVRVPHAETVLWFMPDAAPEVEVNLEHTEALRSVLRSHGIDPEDFTATIDYLATYHIRYFTKLYVDFMGVN